MTPDPNDKLEAAVSRVLRRQTDRRAPAGLEARVLAEIARRAALPWWRTSFAHWPAAARYLFLTAAVLAAGLLGAGLFLLGHSSGAHAVQGGIASSIAWLDLGREIALAAKDRAATLLAAMPSLWLYAVCGAVGISYVALGALGAATYRAFTLGRQNS
jgi:hypothetical protein